MDMKTDMTKRLIGDLKRLGEIGAHQPIGERNTVERLLAVVAKNSRRLKSVTEDEDRNEVVSAAYLRSHEEDIEYSPSEESPMEWAARMLDNERKNFLNTEHRKGGKEAGRVRFTDADNVNVASLEDPLDATARLLTMEKVYTFVKSVTPDEQKAVVMLLTGGTSKKAGDAGDAGDSAKSIVDACGISDYRVRKLKEKLENIATAAEQSDLNIGTSTVTARAQEIDDGVTRSPDYESGDEDCAPSSIDRELAKIGRMPTHTAAAAPKQTETEDSEAAEDARAIPHNINERVKAIKKRRTKFLSKLTPSHREQRNLIIELMSNGAIEREVAAPPKVKAPAAPNQEQQS
jgi:hypothetical protein